MSLTATLQAAPVDQTYSASGGTTWDTLSLNWNSGASAWTNGNNAIFGGGTAGTVTTAASTEINFTNISFTKAYTIALGSGGTFTGATAANGSVSVLDAATGIIGTINAAIGNGTGAATQIIKTGAGTVTLAGANTYTGGTVVRAGTLSVTGTISTTGGVTVGDSTGSADAVLGIGSYAGAISVASGNTGKATINLLNNAALTSAITLNSHDLTIQRVVQNDQIVSGNISGIGNLTISNNDGTSTNNRALTVSSSSINNTGTVTVISGSASTTTKITGALGANVTNYTISSSSNASSRILMSNANSAFTGTFNVSGGTLWIGGTISNPSTNTPGIAALGVGSSFTLDGGTLTLTLNGTTSGQFDTLVGKSGSTFSLTSGTIAFDGSAIAVGTYQIFSGFTSGTVGSITYTGLADGLSASINNSGLLTISAVPEPTTWAAMSVGLSVLFLLRRRRSA